MILRFRSRRAAPSCPIRALVICRSAESLRSTRSLVSQALPADGKPPRPCASSAHRLSLPTMSALHHLLRRSTGAVALVLALAVLLGSVCPRGWFLCVHDETFALVDAHHANGSGPADCDHDDECPSGCPERDGCPAGGGCPGDDGCPDGAGCLDLAVSFVLDDQTNAALVWGTLPSGPLIAHLPDLDAAAALRCGSPPPGLAGGPPPSPFVSLIRLQV